MTMMFTPISGTAWSVGSSCPSARKTVTRTSHDRSHCTYQVDKSALHANIQLRVAISTALIIILLKSNVARWLNGGPSDCKTESV